MHTSVHDCVRTNERGVQTASRPAHVSMAALLNSPAHVVVALYAPILGLDIMVFIRLVCRMYCVQPTKDRKMSAFQQRAHIICFVCVLLTSLCDIAHAVGSIITDIPLSRPRIFCILIIQTAADAFYFLYALLLYAILFQRLHCAFKQTAWPLSRRWFISLSVIMVIQLIQMIFYCINVLVTNCYPAFWCVVSGVQAISFMMVHAALNIFFSVIFITKLRQIVMDGLVRSDWSLNTALDHKTNRKMVNVITKQSIIGISVTVISGGFALSMFITDTFNAETDTDLMADYLVRAMEGLILMFLLYLGLAMNDECYQKVCGSCHRCCYDCAVRWFKQEVTEKYYVMNDSML